MQSREKLFEEYYEKTGIRITEEPRGVEEYSKIVDNMEELHDGATQNPHLYIPVYEELVKNIRNCPPLKTTCSLLTF